MPSHIYLLPLYANRDNLVEVRGELEHESRVTFSQEDLILELSETNSLVEERYCLSVGSTKFILKGEMSYNEVKKAMVHHHSYKHPWKHLQFKLHSKGEVIRIILDPLDEQDYVKCIKGFIHISQDLVNWEKERNKIDVDLQEYFFNEEIISLDVYRTYLLGKIEQAYKHGKMLDGSENSVDGSKLELLKDEKQLLPFLNW